MTSVLGEELCEPLQVIEEIPDIVYRRALLTATTTMASLPVKNRSISTSSPTPAYVQPLQGLIDRAPPGLK